MQKPFGHAILTAMVLLPIIIFGKVEELPTWRDYEDNPLLTVGEPRCVGCPGPMLSGIEKNIVLCQ